MALSDMFNALVGGWRFNNSLLDGVGSADLTNVNSASLIAQGQFVHGVECVKSSSKYLEYSGTTAFRIDDKKWFCTIWFKPSSTSNHPTIIGRWADGANEWLLEVISGTATFYVNCATAGWFTVAQGTVSTSAMNFVILAHDPDDNVIKISFNGGAFSTTAMTSGVATASTKLRFGSYGGDTGYWLDGIIDDVAIGEGYVPTDADAAAIYASGVGVPWSSWGGSPGRLSGDLSFYLKMDETGTGIRVDSSGNGRDFTNNNSCTNATGKVANATNFVRASSQSLSRSDETALRCTGDWHISLWIKFNTLSNYNVIWDKGSSGSEAWIYTQSNGSLVLEVGNYYAYNAASFGSGTLTTGVWYNIVAWRKASTGEVGLCINNGTPSTATSAGTINGSATGMYIGSGNGQHYCDADIDEVAFGQFVPTANDRALYYGAGSPGSLEQLIADFPEDCTAYYAMDGDATDSVGSADLTNQNSVTFGTGALDDCAYVVGASSQKLYRADEAANSPSTKFTLSAWYRCAEDQGGGGGWIGKGAYPTCSWGLRPADNSTMWIYCGEATLTARGDFNLGSGFLNSDTWHHVVVVYDGGGSTNADRLKVYSDGSPITADSFTGTIPSTVYDSSGNFEIGTWLSGLLGYSVGCKFDEVGYWNDTALTGTEIAALYNSGTPLAFPATVYAGHYYQNFTIYRIHLRR